MLIPGTLNPFSVANFYHKFLPEQPTNRPLAKHSFAHDTGTVFLQIIGYFNVTNYVN
jgi:hypothetical protein